MPTRIDWPQALAWRMRRQFLLPVEDASVEEVVRRLCGVQAQVASTAELAVRLRRRTSTAGDVAACLSDGTLVKTWAMRGTLHLLAADDAGAYLSLLAAARSWETPSWERAFGVSASHWDRLRPAVREALDGPPLTRDELVAAVCAVPGIDHLGDALRSGWGTLLKPLAFQGDLVFGPNRGQNVTFTRPELASARWAGIPEPDDAAAVAILGYLRAYGPAGVDGFGNWISRGRISKRRLRGWFDALRPALAQVEVDGEELFVAAEDLDDLVATKPTTEVRLLGGFDQWVLGPGTEDAHVIPPERRWDVSKQSGWIAPIAIAGGRVAGTWELDGDAVRLAWFDAVPPRQTAVDAEVARLSAILDRPLSVVLAPA